MTTINLQMLSTVDCPIPSSATIQHPMNALTIPALMFAPMPILEFIISPDNCILNYLLVQNTSIYCKAFIKIEILLRFEINILLQYFVNLLT